MKAKTELKRNDLVYPDLSYQIIGILFEIYKQIGSGYQEKYYQKIVAAELKNCNLNYKEQVPTPIIYKGNKIGVYFLDFLIENKIILELKRGDKFSQKYIEQVYAYLKATGLKLGIIAAFTRNGVKSKRIVNII
ncbi:MAG: GxxExxY protein [Patescibacteria group bacterium]